MCPKSVVTSCDTEASGKVVEDGEDGGLEVERSPDGLDAAVDRNTHDEGDVQPVDMFVPVVFGYGSFGDVRFLGVV